MSRPRSPALGALGHPLPHGCHIPPVRAARKISRADSDLVGVAGFEPAAPRSQSECATKLRYTPSARVYPPVRAALTRSRSIDPDAFASGTVVLVGSTSARGGRGADVDRAGPAGRRPGRASPAGTSRCPPSTARSRASWLLGLFLLGMLWVTALLATTTVIVVARRRAAVRPARAVGRRPHLGDRPGRLGAGAVRPRVHGHPRRRVRVRPPRRAGRGRGPRRLRRPDRAAHPAGNGWWCADSRA
jgi:hypothetical protein